MSIQLTLCGDEYVDFYFKINSIVSIVRNHHNRRLIQTNYYSNKPINKEALL